MEITSRDKLLVRINRKDWWHVPPGDPETYRKRGKFLAPTFREAEFWGRPDDTPTRVHISNPIIGDEPAIETELLGAPSEYPGDDSPKIIEWRWKLDAKLKKAALTIGYDSIVLMNRNALAMLTAECEIPTTNAQNHIRTDWQRGMS